MPGHTLLRLAYYVQHCLCNSSTLFCLFVIYSFSMLHHLPLCDYVTSYLSISVDGHLGYFGFGANINIAALNILV